MFINLKNTTLHNRIQQISCAKFNLITFVALLCFIDRGKLFPRESQYVDIRPYFRRLMYFPHIFRDIYLPKTANHSRCRKGQKPPMRSVIRHAVLCNLRFVTSYWTVECRNCENTALPSQKRREMKKLEDRRGNPVPPIDFLAFLDFLRHHSSKFSGQ